MRAPPAAPDALVRAIAGLGPTDEPTRRLMAEILRLTPISEAAAPEPLASPVERPATSTAENTARAAEPIEPGPAPVAVPTEPPRVCRLYRLPADEGALGPGPGAVATPQVEGAVGAGPSPLLPRRTSAGVLKALLASASADGDLDVQALIDLIARARPMDRLARRSRFSLAKGAGVIIDRGPGLAPYREDVTEILRALRAVVGVDKLAVRSCNGWPPTSRSRTARTADGGRRGAHRCSSCRSLAFPARESGNPPRALRYGPTSADPCRRSVTRLSA